MWVDKAVSIFIGKQVWVNVFYHMFKMISEARSLSIIKSSWYSTNESNVFLLFFYSNMRAKLKMTSWYTFASQKKWFARFIICENNIRSALIIIYWMCDFAERWAKLKVKTIQQSKSKKEKEKKKNVINFNDQQIPYCMLYMKFANVVTNHHRDTIHSKMYNLLVWERKKWILKSCQRFMIFFFCFICHHHITESTIIYV